LGPLVPILLIAANLHKLHQTGLHLGDLLSESQLALLVPLVLFSQYKHGSGLSL
jgi:hypothetical protein